MYNTQNFYACLCLKSLVIVTRDRLEVKLTGVLTVKPEDAKRLHPVALGWFNDQSAMIEREVARYKLTHDDVDAFLSDDEVTELVKYKTEIGRGLTAFINMDAVSADPLANASIGFSFMMLQLHSFYPIQNIKSLLKKVYERKTANEFSQRLNQEIGKLTFQLDHKQKDLSSYFWAKIQDKRHTYHNFDYVLSKEEEMKFDRTLVAVANKKLERLVSNDLRQFIVLPSRYYRLYFPLPTASYSFEEVPCIDLNFEIFAAAYAEVWLKPGKKNFDGYEFSLPWREEKNGLTLLEKPKFLGYYYLILRPEDLGGYTFWQSIPLALLKGLLNGETKPDGTIISAASPDSVSYKVKGFEEEVDVPDKFAEYLKHIGSIDGMVSMGIMNEKIGNIVKTAFGELEVKYGIPLAGERAGGKDSMKKRAFRLFDEGRRPSDSEVKALGIKPNSAYRYYQNWKKACNHNKS